MSSIAIIGAGMSGLAAAHTLRDAGHSVVIFEKSYAPGGRATTRKRAGFIYDHGAQYIKRGSPASAALITERFSSPDLLDISKPVWTFDGQGQIQKGDARQNAEPKWSYRSGIVTLAERMAADLDIHYETRITRVQQGQPGWTLFTADGSSAGPFSHLLITIPATQALELIAASALADDLRRTITTHLAQASYNPLISVMLGYHPAPRTRPYYALVNTDKQHAISWLAWEHEKAPERAPAGAGLLIAQMAPQYSQDHYTTPDEDVISDVARRVSALIGESLPAPIFTDLQYWRYALPGARADADALNSATIPAGLAFCGDAFVGGRVHLALEHGIAIARQLA